MSKGYCQRRSADWFINKAKSIHGDNYDYSKVVYVDNRTRVIVTCNRCGNTLKIIPFNHFDGRGGCRPCANIGLRKSASEFLDKAHEIHGNNYDYSNMKYVDTKTKIAITCNGCHKIFYQTPSLHISQSNGCPNCICSRGEKKIASVLNIIGVKYIKEAKFLGCVGLGKKPLRFDFYIPSTNTCIEYDGKQHYDKTSKFWHVRTEIHDQIKNEFCETNGIILRRIRKEEFEKIELILSKFVYNQM